MMRRPPRASILAATARCLGVLSLAFMSAACAFRPEMPAEAGTRIARDLTLTLPDASDLGQTVEVSQLVTARYGDQSFTFESHISATPERFLMVGLDSLGRRGMTITWSGTTIDYDAAPWLPGQLRPENVLADMVLLYWPEDIVRQALAPSGGEVTSAPGRRTISKNGSPIVEIEYRPAAGGSFWSGELRYRNLPFNYQLDVLSLGSNR